MGIVEGAIQARYQAVAPVVDERVRRLVLAAEASAAGRGGQAAVARATGASRGTIRRGMLGHAAPPSWRRPEAHLGSATSGTPEEGSADTLTDALSRCKPWLNPVDVTLVPRRRSKCWCSRIGIAAQKLTEYPSNEGLIDGSYGAKSGPPAGISHDGRCKAVSHTRPGAFPPFRQSLSPEPHLLNIPNEGLIDGSYG